MKTKLFTKEYILSIVIMMCCHMGPYLLLSVISIFAKELSGSDTYAGMMVSVFALSGLFARFLSAFLLEKLSCKKVMILSASLLSIASFGYIFTNTYWSAFLLRGIQGLGYGIAITSMSTYIVKIIHPNRLLEGIGYSSLTNSFGGVIGPTVAYAILGKYYDRFQLLFVTVFLFTILTVILLFLIKDIDIAEKNTENKTHESIKINWLTIIVPFLIYFFNSLATASTSSFLSLYAINLGIENIGSYFTINALGLLLSRFTMKKIVDKIGNNNSILLCSIIVSICIYFISIANELWQLLLISFPFGFAMGAIAPILNTIMIENMPSSKSGLANALFYGAADFGFIIGATFWGFISGLFSYPHMFLLASILCCLTIILSFIQIKILKAGI